MDPARKRRAKVEARAAPALLDQRAETPAAPHLAVLELQRHLGNQAVVALLGTSGNRGLPAQREPVAAADPTATSAAHRTLHPGEAGPDVGVLQNKLNTAGADPPLRITETFDGPTKVAVEGFQRRKGLTPDGIAGAHTWAALDTITAGRSMDEATAAQFMATKAQADELRRAGQFAAAEAIYRQLYAQATADPSARTGLTFSLGTCAHALGRFDEAMSFYQEVLALPGTEGSDWKLDAAQRIREARLGQPPGTLASGLNTAPVA